MNSIAVQLPSTAICQCGNIDEIQVSSGCFICLDCRKEIRDEEGMAITSLSRLTKFIKGNGNQSRRNNV